MQKYDHKDLTDVINVTDMYYSWGSSGAEQNYVMAQQSDLSATQEACGGVIL